jgi:hypothetical protein
MFQEKKKNKKERESFGLIQLSVRGAKQKQSSVVVGIRLRHREQHSSGRVLRPQRIRGRNAPLDYFRDVLRHADALSVMIRPKKAQRDIRDSI